MAEKFNVKKFLEENECEKAYFVIRIDNCLDKNGFGEIFLNSEEKLYLDKNEAIKECEKLGYSNKKFSYHEVCEINSYGINEVVEELGLEEDSISLDDYYSNYNDLYQADIVFSYREHAEAFKNLRNKNYSELKKINDRKDIFLDLVTYNEYGIYPALKFANEKLQNDPEVVFKSIKNNPESIEYASKILKNIKFIANETLEDDSWALEFADEKLQKNEKIEHKDGSIYYVIDKFPIENNKEVMLLVDPTKTYKYVVGNGFSKETKQWDYGTYSETFKEVKEKFDQLRTILEEPSQKKRKPIDNKIEIDTDKQNEK